jgi:hypothetical protein
LGRQRELGALKDSWHWAPAKFHAASTIETNFRSCANSLFLLRGWSDLISHFSHHIYDFHLIEIDMPKVKSYSPAWLCRPSPGASLFTSNPDKSHAQDLQNKAKPATQIGATRTIAKRGNEVFVVIDNEIRWSNLARLKDQWQQQARQKKAKEQTTDSFPPSYRVCRLFAHVSKLLLSHMIILRLTSSRFCPCLSMDSSNRFYPLPMALSLQSSPSTPCTSLCSRIHHTCRPRISLRFD